MQIPFIREVDRPRAIREVLHRRTDLSTFVVHLTKDTHDGNQAATNLFSIIQQRRIFARSPMGWATTKDPQTHAPFVVGPALDSQRVVSFRRRVHSLAPERHSARAPSWWPSGSS
jgi:hypothetical protein